MVFDGWMHGVGWVDAWCWMGGCMVLDGWMHGV